MKIPLLFLQLGVLASAPYIVPAYGADLIAPSLEPVGQRPESLSMTLAQVARDAAPNIALCAMLLLVGGQLRRRSGIKDVAS